MSAEEMRQRKNDREKARRAARTEEFRARDREYGKVRRALHAEKLKAKNREWVQNQKENNLVAWKDKQRIGWLRREFGMTENDWWALFEQQEFACAICQTEDPGVTSWHVDHCHSTGVVRGILCRKCNVGIGNLDDDQARLRRAADYLEKTTACPPLPHATGRQLFK